MKDHSNIMGYGGSTGNGCKRLYQALGHLTPILFGGNMHNPTTAPRTRGMNHNAIDRFRITPADTQTILGILTRHDAGTLAPEIPFQGREQVSRMFDKLRFNLREMADRKKVSDNLSHAKKRLGVK
jgi:hypothetical protein